MLKSCYASCQESLNSENRWQYFWWI